jgi:alpha-tubulin suppressor-like RCC1 family protein
VLCSRGINEVGQFGSGSLSPGFRENPAAVPNSPPTGRRVVEVATSQNEGLEHVLAVLDDGQVWAWGYNSDGQLGLGSPNAIFTSPVRITGLNVN